MNNLKIFQKLKINELNCQLLIDIKDSSPQKRPLCLVLHGYGDSSVAYKTLPKELNLPGFNYLLIDAPKKYGKHQAWYSLSNPKAGALDSSKEKLLGLIDEIVTLGWDPKNLYILGHSQGAHMALQVGISYPLKLGGVISVNGYIDLSWINPYTTNNQPILLTHGTKDDLVPLSEFQSLSANLKNISFQVDKALFHKGHEFDHPKEMVFIKNWILKNHRKISFLPRSKS